MFGRDDPFINFDNDNDSLEGAVGGGINARAPNISTDYTQQLLDLLIVQNQQRDQMMATIMERLTVNNLRDADTTFHVMPDMAKIIGQFDGDRDKPKASEWLRSIQTSATLNKWTDNYCLEVARAHLCEPAVFWYRSKSDMLKNWADFVREFKNSFILTQKLCEKWERMRSRIQRYNESTTAYFYEKVTLC